MSTHTISVLVENRHGALSRIAGLFSSRGYNITSLNVAETEDRSVSRMTIVVSGDESILEQVIKQLNRLIDIVKVVDFAGDRTIDRELLLVRVDTSKSTRHEVIELADIFGAKIAGVSARSLTIELTNESRMIDDFIDLIKPYGIKELARTGKIAMARIK
ncbi:MAG: acetolactate synthase small subunit [Chitinivibrionales bacterium]|nr:acetolactate synthase small subunit [Chitinivibrionales bacterium]